MTTVADARAALDAALADWEAAKRFLGDVLAGHGATPTGSVPLKAPGEALQAAMQHERRAELAWAAALKTLHELTAAGGQTLTAKEDHWVKLRSAIGYRSQLAVDLAGYVLHGQAVPPGLSGAYEKACHVEQSLALGLLPPPNGAPSDGEGH